MYKCERNEPKPKKREYNTISFYSHTAIFIHLTAGYQETHLSLIELC